MNVPIGGSLLMHQVAQAGLAKSTPVKPSVVSVPTITRPSVNVATVNPASVHLLNPQVSGFGVTQVGRPRGDFRLPTIISPTIAPTDATLFEEPQDGSKKHYLPRYDLATVQGASRLLKSVALKPSQNSCELVVQLADVTDTAITSGHVRQDATTRYFLAANLQGTAMTWDLTARPIESNGLELRLLLPRPGDVDKVYYAITESAAQARLTIRRSLGVAFPVPFLPSVPSRTGAMGTAMPSGPVDPSKYYKMIAANSNKAADVSGGWSAVKDGARLQIWDYADQPNQEFRFDPQADGTYVIRARLSDKALDIPDGRAVNGTIIQQYTAQNGANQKWKIFPLGGGLVRIAANLSGRGLDVRGGAMASANGTPVQLWDYTGSTNQKWRLVEVGSVTPSHGLQPTTRPPSAPLGQPLYRESSVTIDSSIPFTFSKDLDKNVFEQLEVPPSGPAAYIKRDLVWSKQDQGDGNTYSYYLDSTYDQYGNQPCPIFFFPDIFKIARQPAPPHAPELVVSTNGEDVNSVTLTLNYVASPVWDPRRTEAAAKQLQSMFGLNVAPAPTLFQASNMRLLLNLPSNDPSQPPTLAPQADAIVDLTAGIKGAVTLKLAQFQQIYEALFDNISSLLSGRVEVTVASDVHNIDFKARAADFVGTVFDVKTTVDGRTGGLVAVLQNAIESTIHVDRLPSALTRNGVVDPNCTIEISPGFPIDLPPVKTGASPSAAGNITVALQPPPGKQVDTTCSAFFDFSDTAVVPDPTAIWQAIMSNQVVSPVSRPITFKLVAGLLTSASGGAQAGVVSASGSAGSAPLSSAPSSSPPADAIIAVQVVFEAGQTLGFDSSIKADSAGFLVQQVALAVPIEAYVLQKGSSDNYRYRVDLISPHGTKKGDWITDNKDMVFLSVG